MATKNQIEHGPYGDAWAYRITVNNSMGCMGWHRAKDEKDALEQAHSDIDKFGLGAYDGDAQVERVEVGARSPRTDSHHTHGTYVAEGVEIPFGGACPVQGEGVLDGLDVYYRARGSGWSLTVTISENENWTFAQSPYAWPDGGWLHREESITNICTAVEAFRARALLKDPR